MAAYKHHQVCQRMLWLNAVHLKSPFRGVVQMVYRQRLKAVPRLWLRCRSLVGKALARTCIQVFSGSCKHVKRRLKRKVTVTPAGLGPAGGSGSKPRIYPFCLPWSSSANEARILSLFP